MDRFRPPEAHDVVDVREQIVDVPDFHDLISDLQNADVWRKLDAPVNYGDGGDDQGLRLTLTGGRLCWSRPDGQLLGSLDPCAGIRRIRSLGVGFAGRQVRFSSFPAVFR